MWLPVCIHLMNQNEYPATSEDVLAALPTRTTRVTMNGNYTASFNSRAEDALCAVSRFVKIRCRLDDDADGLLIKP